MQPTDLRPVLHGDHPPQGHGRWSVFTRRQGISLHPSSTRLSPTVIALTVLAASLRWRDVLHPDIVIQQQAARALLSPAWTTTYVAVPTAQMGPLAIALIELPRSAYIALTSLLVLPFLHLGAPPGGGSARRLLWCAASIGLVVPWSQFAWKGHADDALVLCCAAGTVWAVEHDNHRQAVLAFVVGMAAKPTALLLAPVIPSEGLLAGFLGAGLLWAPFVCFDPAQFLRAGRGVMHVSPQSLWGRAGVSTGPPPAWLRPSQLALAMGAASWARARGCASVAVLAAFTLRSLLEMTPAPAYAASVVALALVADARQSRAVPIFTLLGLAAFWTSQPALDGASGWPRIVAHLALLAVAVVTVVNRRPSATTRGAASGEPVTVANLPTA